MKTKPPFRLLVCALLLGFAHTFVGQSLNGYWIGTLEIKSTPLILEFHINGSDTTGYEVNMRSPMQTPQSIPVNKFDIRQDSVSLAIPPLRMIFNGSVSTNRQQITGVFNQAGLKLPLTLHRSASEFSLNRPQTPIAPYPYSEENLMIPSGDIRLGASLCLPEGNQKVPVVLLLTGSGSQNRDEEIFGHKPFKVIADALARQGIATLRMDDRGVAHSGGNLSTANYQLLVSDVQAALDYLNKHPRIHKKKIGILGHSEGSNIAWLCAQNDKRVRFLVLMAGPGIQGSELLLSQNRTIFEAMASPEIAELRVQILKPCLDIAMSELDDKPFRILDTIRQLGQALTEEQRQAIGFQSEASKVYSTQLLMPMMVDFLRFNPAHHPFSKKIKLLILNGDKDTQVDPIANTEGFRQTLLAWKHPNFSIQRYPGLNHLFQNCTTGLSSEYAFIEETISTQVLDELCTWIRSTCKLK